MRVVVVGCGVVGAAIAYHLSDLPNCHLTVIDRQQPAQAATGAALGVLMAAISTKAKGKNLRWRLAGVETYNTWIPKLSELTGREILFNQQGILRLCCVGESLERWRSLQAIRHTQGWSLELLTLAQLAAEYPHVQLERVIGAVYSPGDRQVDPVSLTLALVDAAQQQGVQFRFNTDVLAIEPVGNPASGPIHVQLPTERLTADWLIIAAGLGSTPLIAPVHVQPTVDLRPVLGQAAQVQCPEVLGDPARQPVITGEDVHLVPLGQGRYWVGATVEFPANLAGNGEGAIAPDPTQLETVMQQAISLWPGLQTSVRLRQWFGLRPRPEGRPAPIVEQLPGNPQIILATGHYRNGVLLAPATAMSVRQMLARQEPSL
jgi:glycine oxidase